MRTCWQFVFAAALAVLLVVPAQAQKEQQDGAAPQDDSFVLSGKLYCSLVRGVIVAKPGVVEELLVNTGDHVEEGQTVLRLRLDEQERNNLQRMSEGPNLKQWEYRLFQAGLELEKAERDYEDLKVMVDEKVAPPNSMQRAQRVLEAARKNVELLGEQKKAALTEASERLKLLRKELDDKRIRQGYVPAVLDIKAPMAGYVLDIDPAVREGAWIKDISAMSIGVMDPMLVQALVFEREALKLQVGDEMRFWLESAPENVYPATVSRISWRPTNRRFDQPSYYQVELTAPNPNIKLREGYNVLLSY